MEEKRIDAKILRDYINSRESEITDTWTPEISKSQSGTLSHFATSLLL